MPAIPSPLTSHVPVLIVGGGFAGLTAALCLQRQGVTYRLIERHPGTSILPKARSLDVRTMEIFRELGLSEALREAGRNLAPAWGVLHGSTLADALEDQPPANTENITSLGQKRGYEALAAQSPESGARCTQDFAEPVLRQAAEARGGDLRFHHEMTRFEQDDDRVSATVRDRDAGTEETITADYLLAADGANSPVRRALNLSSKGRGGLGHFINIYFEADLTERVKGREFSMFLIDEPGLTCFLLAVNNRDRWALHLRYDPEKGQQPSDFPEPVLLDALNRVLGMPGLPLRILGVSPWEMTVRTVDRQQVGRVFLTGDAAHTMTPYAGKGAAAGVQDTHNLAWKLSAVLRGQAGPALLDSYTPERQPIGAFYADLSGDMADDNGLVDEEKLKENGKVLVGLPDYTYRSSAILSGEPGPTTPASALPLAGRPGTRLPHLWLDERRTESTLDWCRGAFVLVASGESAPWQSVVGSSTLPLPMELRELPNPEAREAWQRLTGTRADEALLVRPDGFVAARLSKMDGAADLAASLRRLVALA